MMQELGKPLGSEGLPGERVDLQALRAAALKPTTTHIPMAVDGKSACPWVCTNYSTSRCLVDDVGRERCVLPADTSDEMMTLIANLIANAFSAGERHGRDELRRDLRKLIGAPSHADLTPVRFGG